MAVKLNLNLPVSEELLSSLETDLQSKIRNFKNPEDRLRSICGDLLVRIGVFEQWKLLILERH